jgi:streptogramin lyase
MRIQFLLGTVTLAAALSASRLPDLPTSRLPVQSEADSARVAREAYRAALPLYRRGEYTAAREQFRRALNAWPMQQAYPRAYASVSARLADTAETVRALTLLADMGLTVELSDSDFTAVRDAPAVRAVAARLTANAAPLIRSTVAATLVEPDFWPEGISHDAHRGVWYVASVRHRKVARIDRKGGAHDFITEGQDSLWAALGVRADPEHSTLWVTTAAIPQMAGYVAADSGRSGIFAFDLESGKLKARYLLPASAAGHLLGDLVVAPNGDVYATDSRDPAIWKIPRDSTRAEQFLRHPLFRSLQGPVLDPSGKTLYVADYSVGVLAIELASRAVRALPTPPRSTALGIDGLVWYRGSLIGVQNGVAPARVVRLRLDPAGQRIENVEVLDRHLPLAAEATIGTVWGDRYFYVANSQWEAYDNAGRLKPGVRLEPLRILELRLR